MAVELVEIVNPNGRKGFVSAKSRAAASYKTPPSARTQEPNEAPGPSVQPPEMPARNAGTEVWRAYASHSATPNGLSSEAADLMNRDELVAHFESQED